MKQTNFKNIGEAKSVLQYQIDSLEASPEIKDSCLNYVTQVEAELDKKLKDLEADKEINESAKEKIEAKLRKQALKDFSAAPSVFKLIQTLSKGTQFQDVSDAKNKLIARIKEYKLDEELETALISNISEQNDLNSLQKAALVLNLIEYSFSATVLDYSGKPLDKSLAIGAFMQGGHLAIPDGGHLEKALKSLSFLSATARRSSHYTKTRKDIGGNSFQAEGVFNEVLFGRAQLVDTKGLPAISYFQLENSPFVAPTSMKAIKQNVSHTVDFLRYVATKKNIGQYGSSEYTDSRTMLAVPAEMDTMHLEAKQKKVFDMLKQQENVEIKNLSKSIGSKQSQNFIQKYIGMLLQAIANKFRSQKSTVEVIKERGKHLKELLRRSNNSNAVGGSARG